MPLSFSCSSPEAESVFVTARKGSLHLLQGWPQPSFSIPTGRLKLGGLDITELMSHTAGAVTQPVYHILIYKELFPHFTCTLRHYTFYGTSVYKHGSQEASILTKPSPVFSWGLSVSFSFLLSVLIIFFPFIVPSRFTKVAESNHSVG